MFHLLNLGNTSWQVHCCTISDTLSILQKVWHKGTWTSTVYWNSMSFNVKYNITYSEIFLQSGKTYCFIEGSNESNSTSSSISLKKSTVAKILTKKNPEEFLKAKTFKSCRFECQYPIDDKTFIHALNLMCNGSEQI